jgi:hypothetical protein
VEKVRLRGSPIDPRLVWMVWPDGHRTELGWPVSYSARFTPQLELLDGNGHVIARDGSRIEGGCSTADPQVMSVDFAAQEAPP